MSCFCPYDWPLISPARLLNASCNVRTGSMFRDRDTGLLKGDALINFLQRPSVSLACTIMHGRALRMGRGKPMTVQEATFSTTPGDDKSVQPGRADTSAQAKREPSGKGAKSKGKKAAGQQNKALGWGGFDDTHKASEVTVVLTNLFSLEDMTLSPDLEEALSKYIIRRCSDLGAIEKVRVFRKSSGGVATARFRVPDDAQAAIQRFSSTAVIWGMLSPQEMRSRGAERVAEVEEDVVERASSLGVRLAGEASLSVLFGEAGHGMVVVACSDVASMQRLVLSFDGAAYDGRILKADSVEASLWDGETPMSEYGVGNTASDDAARLEAYAAELERS